MYFQYGSDSLGSGSAGGTFPQAMTVGGGGDFGSAVSQSSAFGPGIGVGSQLMPPPSSSVTAMESMVTASIDQGGDVSQATAAYTQNSQYHGEGRGNKGVKSILNQRIKKHMNDVLVNHSAKTPSSNGAGLLTCCIFLDKQDDVNKEVS